MVGLQGFLCMRNQTALPPADPHGKLAESDQTALQFVAVFGVSL